MKQAVHNVSTKGERQVIDIDELTIGQAKALAIQVAGASQTAPKSPHIGKKCIIRCYASGVHYGVLVSQAGRQVDLRDARRLWRFDAKNTGISLSEVANHGGVDGRHRFCEVVSEITLLDAIEIIPTTPKATRAIDAAPVARAS